MNLFHALIVQAFAATPPTPPPDGIIPIEPTNIPKGNFASLTGDVINIIFGVAGGITIIVIVVLGYQMFTAKGKDEEFKKALQGISYAAMGLTILGLAYAVVIAFMNYLSAT
jgi:hypothetical protein